MSDRWRDEDRLARGNRGNYRGNDFGRGNYGRDYGGGRGQARGGYGSDYGDYDDRQTGGTYREWPYAGGYDREEGGDYGRRGDFFGSGRGYGDYGRGPGAPASYGGEYDREESFGGDYGRRGSFGYGGGYGDPDRGMGSAGGYGRTGNYNSGGYGQAARYGGAGGGRGYGDIGRGGYGREGMRRDEGRGWWDRTGDEVRSWFGDDDAERRRRMDDHRGRGPKGYSRSDDRIREDVCDRLSDDPRIDASDIEIQVSSGEVTLSGTVSDRQLKRHAEDCVEDISGVNHVQNNLRVQQGSSGTSGASPGGGTSAGTKTA